MFQTMDQLYQVVLAGLRFTTVHSGELSVTIFLTQQMLMLLANSWDTLMPPTMEVLEVWGKDFLYCSYMEKLSLNSTINFFRY